MRFLFPLLLLGASAVAPLPSGALIAGYAPKCDANVTRAVESGVNVLYWFASNLLFNDTTGEAYVDYGGPALDCIAQVAADFRARNLSCTHMVSVGGWDAPHVETETSAAALFAAWHVWNKNVVARPGLEAGFDGIDWDLEGNDLPSSPFNFFTAAVLDSVGRFSVLAKEAGYVVSMVPPESYLDPTTSAFDQSLLHAYPDGWQPAFKYHGHNAYAYMLSRYGTTHLRSGANVPTFDVVLIQLYETFSHLTYNITVQQQSGESYLSNWVPTVVAGWDVDFGSDAAVEWPSGRVSVPASRLLVGFGNG